MAEWQNDGGRATGTGALGKGYFCFWQWFTWKV